MPNFKPCTKCQDRYGDFDVFFYRWFGLCEDCDRKRERYLQLVRMDRSYRAHLARRVLDVPCDTASNCPENPPGHASFDVVHAWSNSDCRNESKDTFMNVYRDIIELALNQFRRPQRDDTITSFELLAGQYELDSIKYCPTCLENAWHEFPQSNDMVQLCTTCWNMRDEYIKHFHNEQTNFVEPWESPLPHSLVHYNEMDERIQSGDCGFDDWFEMFALKHIGGGGMETIAAMSLVIAALLGLNQAYLGWCQRRHNNQMYELTTQQYQLSLRQYRHTIWQNQRITGGNWEELAQLV